MFSHNSRKVVKRKKLHAPLRAPRFELLEDRSLPSTSIAEFPVLTSSASPWGITTGPDGNIWFTENAANKIGMINPTTHAVTEYTIPTAKAGPMGIAAGPDGNIWFTEFGVNAIGEFNLTTHLFSQFLTPTTGSGPAGITAGPDGNLWFTEFSAGQIGVINPGSDVITEFATPTASSAPLGITAGPDGNVWFTESAGNNIATISPATHTINEYQIPQSGSQPYEIVAGSNGAMWFSENAGDRIGEINISTFAYAKALIPTSGSAPYGIAPGADGNIWFVESSGDQIGEIAMATGAITETPLPTASAAPIQLTTGPGGTLWFTESSGNQIGEVLETPTVLQAPNNESVTEGRTATFQATGTGVPTPGVQWYLSSNGGSSFLPLINAGNYSGVTTDTLTITDATTAMSGFEFEAVFGNGVSPAPSAVSTPATLTVKSILSITPALPPGIVGNTYNETLSVEGGTTPLDVLTANNFSAGTTGLTASDITTNMTNGTVTITGTPTGAGTATFTITAANTAGNSLTQNMTITIDPPLSISTASLPGGTANTPYSQAIDVVGGAMPYTTFSVANFSAGTTGLKAGAITASKATGVFSISGIPTAAGTATFTVNVTDTAGETATKNYTITINPPLAITSSLPSGTANAIYDQTLTVTGGGVPYSSLTVTKFAAGSTGLTASAIATSATAGTVTIDGTPTAAGVVSFTVNVVDAIGATLTKAYSFAVNPGLAITPSLPQGTAGMAYHQTITLTGGATPYANFAVSGLSAGTTGLTASALTVNPAGTIVVSGTPTAAGTLSFTVNVTDAIGSHLTQNYNVTINPMPTIGSLTTTQWTAGKAGFTGTMTIGSGTSPFTIVASGLPTGLSAVVSGSTINFTGTPTSAGTFASGSITLHDAAGASVTKTFSITINPAPSVGSLTATQWTVGMSGFGGIMSAAGGTGGLTLTAATGLPTGLTASLAGNTIKFTGTPTATGTFAGSVTLDDAIAAAVTKTFSIAINAVPTLGGLTTTQWTAAKSGFNGSLPIAGGTGPFTITSATGLPAGLSAAISGNAVVITGTPTMAQTVAGSVSIHDAAGASATKSFSITINPPILIVATALPASTMGMLYGETLQATGGTGAITFSISAGSLPPGMKLSSTGAISGVSRGVGSFTFTVTATDALGAKVSEKFTLALTVA